MQQSRSAGRVGAKRRIETKRVTQNSRSLGFDTLRYSTGVRFRLKCALTDKVVFMNVDSHTIMKMQLGGRSSR
jgi:hypothetical protein